MPGLVRLRIPFPREACEADFCSGEGVTVSFTDILPARRRIFSFWGEPDHTAGANPGGLDRYTLRGSYGAPIHLHDAEPAEGRPSAARDPEGDLPLVLPGREDRRPRVERRGQVDAAQDHGGRRHGLRRRRGARGGHAHRISAAGPAARHHQGRARQRRARRREDPRALEAVRRAEREDGRGALRGRERKAHGRVPARAGRHRGDQRVGARPAARDRDGRAAAAAARRRRDEDLGRRAAPRRALQDPARTARPAAPRRADQPPRRGIRRVARAAPRRVSRDRRRRHARPLLPRQRRRLDPGARPRRGHPVGGQLFELARAEGAAARDGGEAGVGEAADAEARARVGEDVAARAPGQEQGAPREVRDAARRQGAGGARRDAGPLHPARTAPGRRRRARRGRPQVLRRPPPHGGPLLRPSARRHRRDHRAQRRRARRRSSR